ncbi:MAG: pentapeptide repeat-containing protein [Bacteroidota bacterium]
MKNSISNPLYIIIVVILFFGINENLSAQKKTITAEEIMAMVKKGENINFENVTVDGVLDFTFMEEKIDELPKRDRWWNGGDNTVEEDIEVNISFVNCEFKDDVLAYFHDERSEYTFVAHFDRNAIFKNCKFNGLAAFKYTDFQRNSDFSGSTFEEGVNFKYAEFEEQNSFAEVTFYREANFKYAEFEQKADYTKSVFEDDANFKYSKFRRGVSFNDVRFEDSVDMKYTKVRGDFDVENLYVRRDIDTKYTDINGNSFSSYMLKGDR